MKPIFSLFLFWAIVLSGTAQSHVARLVAEPCPESWVPLAAPGMTCGRLRVPQDRSAEDSPEISLFVVQLPAREDSDNWPIVYLAGGPGDSASADSAWWLNTTLRDARDIILIDQRGAGLSRPSLNCPEFDASDDEDRLNKCRDRLLSAGVRLSAYNAESIAQDIADLIVALELDQVNIYARSYGARLALLLARKLPQRVRAMALDSAYTGEESALASAAASAWRSMLLLYADCRANDACHAAYPELSAQFSRAAAALDSQPVTVDELLPGSALRLDKENFVLLLRDMLADADRLPFIPALIAAIAKPDYDFLVSMASIALAPESPGPDRHSEGLYFSALCADEAALVSSAKIKAGVEGLPAAVLPLLEAALNLLVDCGSWIDAGGGASGEPPRHGIPTLHLAGAYDPIAPGVSSESPLFWRLVFPHLGHGVLEYEPCAEAVVAAFLANPREMPLDSCLQELRPPAFYIRRNE